VDTRTRWIVGILVALVIGLGVALIIVAADDSNDSGSTGTTSNPRTATLTEPTTTSGPTTTSSRTTSPNGGTGVPGSTTTPGGGSGGL
jgi:hypothetical protein